MSMRIALGQFGSLDETALRFARQIGVSGIQVNTPLLPPPPWTVSDLSILVEQAAAHDLRFEAIENTPTDFYRAAILGGSGRDRAIADYQENLRRLAEARIPTLGFHWMARGVRRTSWADRGRGGARVTAFDLELFDDTTLAFGRRYEEAELWDNFHHFLEAVLPVAEEVGVRLALHPDDPPVPSLQGVPNLFRSIEALERAIALHPSSSFGIDLCLGTMSESADDPVEAIHRLGPNIAYVHFRDVRGKVPAFEECHLGEGNFDPVSAMRALHEVSFDGFIIDDHVPLLDADPAIGDGWAYGGHAHATGYLQGLLAAVGSELAA